MHLGARLNALTVRKNHVNVIYLQPGRGASTQFLDASLRQRLRCVEDTPVLKRNFEASIPGLYVVGLASANCFGPLTRFACGAGYTARSLCRTLS